MQVISVSWLEAVRLLAHSQGYYDIDVEPFPEFVKITVTKDGCIRSASGANLTEACKAIWRRLT